MGTGGAFAEDALPFFDLAFPSFITLPPGLHQSVSIHQDSEK